jgi:HSP20 family molecular chaperone IbpA
MDKQFAKIMRKMVVARISSTSFSLWEPPIDLYESDCELIAFMEAAGIDAGQIKIMVEPKMLTIKGERKCPVSGITTVHQLEVEYGRFARQLQLPKAIDTNRVTSECRQGFLIVRMPLLEIQNTVEIFVK